MAQLNVQIDFGSGFVNAQPRNWRDIRLEAIFTSTVPSATLQSINFEFMGEDARKINKYIADGLTGGRGILEGLPLKVFLGTLCVFNGCLDLANNSALYECDIVKCPIKESGKIDWLNDVAQSFSFAYLESIGIITTSDYKKTPYTVTSIPDMAQVTMLMLEEFVLIRQLIKEVAELDKQLNTLFGDAGDETSPYPGSATYSLTFTIFSVAVEVAYITALLIGIVNIFQDIIAQIIQTGKYKYCMRVEDLFKKACQYLGIQFSSSIFSSNSNYYNTTIMPKKMVIPNIGGFPFSQRKYYGNEYGNPDAYGYYEGTFKQFLDQVGLVFNAKPYIHNGILTFEEVHYYNVQSGFVMPNQGDQGYTYNYPAPFGVNASELSSSYELRWALDSGDTNTVHQYQGTSCEVIIQPNTIGNNNNLLLPGLTNIELPFAMAKRKEYLSFVEQAINKLTGTVIGAMNQVIYGIQQIEAALNTIIGWFGGSGSTIPSTPFMQTVTVQIGFLELSNDSFEIQKMFIGENKGGDWQVWSHNYTAMSANEIMQNFHGKNLLSRGNQWKIYRGKKCKMCATEFVSILEHNIFTTSDQKQGKFDRLIWNPHNDSAEGIDYRVNEVWTNNYKEKVIVDGN